MRAGLQGLFFILQYYHVRQRAIAQLVALFMRVQMKPIPNMLVTLRGNGQIERQCFGIIRAFLLLQRLAAKRPRVKRHARVCLGRGPSATVKSGRCNSTPCCGNYMT